MYKTRYKNIDIGVYKYMNNKNIRRKKVIDWTNIILVIGLIVLIGVMTYTAFQKTAPAKSDMEYKEFIALAEEGRVIKASIVDTEDTFNVYLDDSKVYSVINPGNEDFKKELLDKGIALEIRKANFKDALTSVILSVPSILIVFVMALFVIKYLGGTASTMFKVLKNEECTTFDDVAGMNDVKSEVQFAIDTLKHYKDLYKAGARPTKGIILEGPPGTGKTLIAKAIAGEAKVPFISTSGSDFVEMFAGLGASRVRALWELAITNAPCVIFIDEIDAVGRRRQSANSGAQMESNQTLNALLQKMDGLGGDSGILVVAATNMMQDLDPALLRPGRFDKKIYIGAPKNKEDRDAIIKVHLRHKKLADDFNFDTISKHLFGMTGAEIESVLNEAVILSIRRQREGILSDKDIDDAAMQLRVSGVVMNHCTESDKRTASIHEAGHAVMNCLMGKVVTKVSITAYNSGVGGVTITDGDMQSNQFRTKEDIESDIKVLLAGRVAEMILIGKGSTGCENDLERATELAKGMVGLWGMRSESLVSYTAFYRDTMISDGRQDMLGSVTAILNSMYEECSEILKGHKKEIEALACELVKNETILDYKLNGI